MTKKPDISKSCIYTMRKRSELEACQQNGGKDRWKEQKKWVTGYQLFQKSKDAKALVPIIFSAADEITGVIYYGFLTDVSFEERDGKATVTIYSFTNLTPLRPPCPLSSLILVSTNKPLSDKYIRPYAICHTPKFVF